MCVFILYCYGNLLAFFVLLNKTWVQRQRRRRRRRRQSKTLINDLQNHRMRTRMWLKWMFFLITSLPLSLTLFVCTLLCFVLFLSIHVYVRKIFLFLFETQLKFDAFVTNLFVNVLIIVFCIVEIISLRFLRDLTTRFTK